VYGRHRRWSVDGTWAKILDALRAGCDEAEGQELGCQRGLHRGPCTPARRRCPPRPPGQGALANDQNPAAAASREALGRSRGGLTTKVHLAADRRCRPLTSILTPGEHGDCPQFIPVMDQISITRRGKGRPRTRPGAAMADKACSSAANRAYLRKRGIKAVIPVKEDQKDHRRARGRQFRAVATRYGKRKEIYQGTVDLRSIRIWLRDPPHDLQDTA
jgi:transposase